MQFIHATVDERDFVVVVHEEDEIEDIKNLVAEYTFNDSKDVKIGKRTVTCNQIINTLGLMHFDMLEIKDESEMVEDSW
jgi:hypothetical protein